MHKLRYKLGFSLIELMVVISIIGVLMAIGAVSYTTAQRKARDSARINAIDSVGKALEQYYADNAIYPTNAGCNALFSSGNYFQGAAPVDPKPAPYTQYSLACNATGSSFCLCARLEADDSGNSGASCAWSATGDYHCVANQQ